MFTERLVDLMKKIGVNSGELASYAGVDRTSISRLRSGNRRVAPDSTTIKKVAHGIVVYAAEKGKSEVLFEYSGGVEDKSDTALENAIINWLYEGEDSPNKKERRSRAKEKRIADGKKYGSKLDAVMKLTGLSNVYVCRRAGVDAGVMSRYRSGRRLPDYDNPISRDIAAVIWERVVEDKREATLAKLMDFPADILDQDFFYRWLIDYNRILPDAHKDIIDLLNSMDSFPTDESVIMPAVEDIVPPVVYSSKTKTYEGYAGLQDAVIRFLANAVRNKSKELLLYSDEGMEWMMQEGFYQKWAVLMRACISHGTRIRIIHNIDRDLGEMNKAIISWMPLYVSGMIESYFSKKTCGDRFSNTLFIDPCNGAIEGHHVRGNEASGVWLYHTRLVELEHLESEFGHLLESCAPLVRFYPDASQAQPEDGEAAKTYEVPYATIECLRVSDNQVELVKSGEPSCVVRFTHPLICRAFKVYVKELQRKK